MIGSPDFKPAREEVLKVVRRIFCTVVMVAAVATYMGAQETLVADVPFSFQVNQQVLPAGNYSFGRASSDLRTMSIRGEGTHVFALSSSVGESSGVAKLIFRHIGDQYILTRISGLDLQRDFPLSAEQQKLARNSEERVVLARN